VEAAKRPGPGLREHADDRRLMRISLTKQIQREAEFVDMHSRLGEMQAKLDELQLSHNLQIGQLTNVRAKLEAKESELEAVRLQLKDAEKGLTKSKPEADTLRAQIASGSANRDEDQVMRRLMERVQAIEAEMLASKQRA